MTIQNICIKVCFKLHKTSREILATKCGFTIIIQKVNISFLRKNGSSPCPKKVKKSNHTPRAHWWFYLRALFITNLFLQTKQFTSISSRRSSRNVRNTGRTRTGWFTTPMCQLTLLHQYNNFWLPKTCLWSSPSLLAHYGPLWIILASMN